MAQAKTPSKYFAAARSSSSSPSAFLPRHHTTIPEAKGTFASSFKPVLKLLRETDESTTVPGFLAARNRESASSTSASKTRAISGTKEAVDTRGARQKGKSSSSRAKTSYKSAEYVLDSEDSEDCGKTRQQVGAKPAARRSHEPDLDIIKQRNIAVQTVESLSDVGQPPVNAEPQRYMAPVRRRSWTPVEDTVARSDAADTEATPTKTFSDIVSGFQYSNPDQVPSDMAPPAKKRKTAVTDKASAASAPGKPKRAPRAPKEPKAKAVRVPKEPKVKKIRAPKEPKPKAPKKKAQTITAIAMAPYIIHPPIEQSTIPEALANIAQDATVVGPARPVAKPRKRKPANSADAANKAKRPRVKSKVDDKMQVHRCLLPPTQAQSALSEQTFIFGTSSQLRTGDSPELISQLQHVLEQSELSQSASAFNTPVKKSKLRIPTAPHGTSLSIGQADRDLWCVGAVGTLTGETIQQDPQYIASDPLPEDVALERSPNAETATGIDTAILEPIIHNELPQVASPRQNARQHPSPESDSFEVLSSSSAEPLLDLDDTSLQQLHAQPHASSRHNHDASPSRDTVARPSQRRPVLKPLDANLTTRHPLAEKQQSAMRFRDTSTTMTRPVLKTQSSVKENETQNTPIEINSSSPPRLTSPSTILTTIQSSPPSEWHNIDEISDSEAAAATPSPPRKRTSLTSKPATLQFDHDEPAALQLDHDEPDLPVSAPNRPSKEVESQWTATFAKLFPQITFTIRAVPRSNSLTSPTWHEKILLYDPIVIEDLTAWLNVQGLRVQVRRTKPKSKSKAREQETIRDDEHTKEEELQHWMVQKWCEEHSICCLWKEGLRGGVRTRY